MSTGQKEYAHIPPRVPGGKTPILHGVRVVEISEVVAAPSCASVLGQLGAEVVKVESPRGDMFRAFCRDLEKGREYSTCFEAVNWNKSSVVLDLKKKADLDALLETLDGADVFVTNIRPVALRSLKLDYETLSMRCPRLVFAQLSGWGREGPEFNLPGYDLGSFWGMSGLASILHPEGMLQMMSIGFGDTATGIGMVAGVLLALTDRLHTGRGQLVDASLLRNGYWCMSRYLCNTENHEMEDMQFTKQIPDYAGSKKKFDEKFGDVLYDIYESKDGVFFGLLGESGEEPERSRRLHALQTWLQVSESSVRQSVREKFKTIDFGTITKELHRADIPFCRTYNVLELYDARTVELYKKLKGRAVLEDPCPFLPLVVKSAACFAEPPSLTAADPSMFRLANIPFRCHSSSEHGLNRSPPSLGAHTDSFLSKRWSPRVTDLDGVHKDRAHGLKGVVVVELSGVGSAVAGACVQLHDYGARVIKIVGPQGDYWKKRDPAFYNHLSRGKEVIELDLKTSTGINRLLELLSQATVFATNWSVLDLEECGLDHTTVRAKFPALIYMLTVSFAVSLFGEGSLEMEREMHKKQGTLGSQWLCSGLSHYLGGGRPVMPPSHLLDQISSCSVVAGIAAALFHLHRTGEGQLVDVSHMRAGVYTMAVNYAMTQHDPIKFDFFHVIASVKHRLRFASPTSHAVRTKDGVWVQLLGVELPRHIHPMLRTLGARAHLALRLIPAACKFAFKQSPSGKMFSAFPIFEAVNGTFSDSMGNLTWEQVKTLFDANNIWYVPILTPELAVRNRQAHNSKIFRLSGNSLQLNAPVQLRSQPIRAAL